MNRWKKKSGLLVTLLFAALCLALPVDVRAEELSALAGGPPDGKGRKPDKPGGSVKGDLLGDLWVVVRDVSSDGDGEPIRFTWTWTDACIDAAGDFDSTRSGCYPISTTPNVVGGCVQPITLDELNPPVIDPDTNAEKLFTYDQYVDSEGDTIIVNLIPLDPECKIPAGYETTWGAQTTEVDSGRLALARTTDYVIEAAYNEAIAVINSSVSVDMDNNGLVEPAVTLDAAGRLLLILLDDQGLPYFKTVDSPRENLALYQRLLLEMKNGKGCLPGITVDLGDLFHLACTSTTDDPNQDLLRAASFLAGAADKSGAIGIDEVIYLNSILGINTITETTDSLLVTGYFDFKFFTYDRSNTYSAVTASLLQPGATLESGYPTTFEVKSNVPIYEKVFFDIDWVKPENPIINFVRASDDAVSVIYYIHNYELPKYLPLEPDSSLSINRRLEVPLAPVRNLAD